MAFVNEILPDRKGQTIDRERDIVLKKIHGSTPSQGYEFALSVNGCVIKFHAESSARVHGTPKVGEENLYDMKWQIYKIYRPQECTLKADEIYQFIKEALEVYGWNYRTDKAASVSVTMLDYAKGQLK